MKKFTTIVLVLVLLVGCVLFTSCVDILEVDTIDTDVIQETERQTSSLTELPTETDVEDEASTESTVMRIIHRLGFNKVDEEILKRYIPTYSCTVDVEKKGLSSIKLTTLFCGEYVSYYILLNREGEIMKITSTEKDYDSRFVYYPRESQEEDE